MGYNTHVSGEIEISPPLIWREFMDSPFYEEGPAGGGLDVRLDIRKRAVETDEGQLTRITATALIPSWDEPYKAYHLLEHVQQAIDAFPGHTFTGRLSCAGEDNEDMWRVVVRDGRAERVDPQLLWPDENQTVHDA